MIRVFFKTLWSLLRTYAVFAKQPLRGRLTHMYPDVPENPPQRYRGGTFALTYDTEGQENCIGCRLCEQICPSHIISVTLVREEGRSRCGIFDLDLQACLQCEMCVQVCPTDAIVMTRERQASVRRRQELFLDRDILFANGKTLTPVWGTGNGLREMQGGKRLK